jgi:S-adenosyl-L-methionine hydrolase (adenosine-forming)
MGLVERLVRRSGDLMKESTPPPRLHKTASNQAPIALLTDFGYRDHYVGVMRGVISSIAPGTQIIDLTHGVPPQQIAAGALELAQSWRFFPRRTIFLAVVDPGVGTQRLPIAVETRAGARFVGPDNGLMWMAAEEAGIKTIVELRSPRHRLPDPSSTFHGRDIFAPAAAWISRGVRLAALGPKLSGMVPLDVSASVRERRAALEGVVIYVDGFGNLVTNLSHDKVERFAAHHQDGILFVRIGRRARLAFYRAYGDAQPGAPLALFGSFGTVEIACRDASAASHFGVGAGAAVTVTAQPT